MSQNKKNLYEGMYLITATAGDDVRNKILEKIQSGITHRGGEIVKIHDQGRKRLSYEIKRQREGYYYLIYFTIDPTQISHLWEDYHLTDELLRYITLRTDKVLDKIEFKSLIEQ
jgi:small subunit ribosomal protein S6